MNLRALLIPVAAVAAIVLVLLTSQCERRRANEAIGNRDAVIAMLRRDSIAKAAAIRRVDSVFQRDTVRLSRTLTRFRTRVDSLLRTDTLTVRESVIVATADTTIRACQRAVTSCTERVAARDSMIVLLGFQRQTDAARHRAELARANPRLLPYVEGHVDPLHASTVTARAGVELRLFGPFRISAAGQYTNLSEHHPWSALAGVRVTF